MSSVYILGAGSQARETYQVYLDNGCASKIAGFIVTKRTEQKNLLDKKIFDLKLFKTLQKNTLLISAVGNSLKRKTWIEEISKYSFKYDTPIHKSAVLGRNVVIKEGTTVCANSVLTCDIKVGKHVLINVGCTVSHDVKLSDFVTLSPGVNVGGRVVIGEGTYIGIGAKIIQDVKIGKNCFIGAGAAVVKDIPNNSLAVGVPAKPIRRIQSRDWDDLI